MEDALRMVEVGSCGAWPLPGDPTCAGVARRAFRRAAGELSLVPELVDDGVTMVSELAANTLHVHDEAPRSGAELWLYLRGSGPRRELVCKIFDSYPGWLRAPLSGRGHRVSLDAMSGRGLEVVHELSAGHWGYHLTRSRLGDEHARGKAVWFAIPAAAVPAPAAPADPWRDPARDPGRDSGPGPGRARPGSAREAMAELEAALAARGFSALVRADDPAADMAVLSVCSGLTVWCRAGVAWLRAPGMNGERWSYADLVEVEEQAVHAHETLAEAAGEAPSLAGVSRTGALTPATQRAPAASPRPVSRLRPFS
jgi:hypothetical protein